MANPLVISGIYANHPRLLFRDTDLSSLITRSNNTAGWKADYDAYILTAASTYASTSSSTFISASNADDFFEKILCLLVAARVEGNSTWLAAAKAHALQACTVALDTNIWYMRSMTLGLAYCWDLLYGQTGVTDANLATIGNRIVDWIDKVAGVAWGVYTPGNPTTPSPELMDGHDAANLMCSMVACLALKGHSSGSYDYTAGANDVDVRLTDTLDFWFGGSAAHTTSGYAKLDSDRYYKSGYKGGWYQFTSWWSNWMVYVALNNATTGMTLNGDAYDPWDESWLDKVPEYALNIFTRGDGDYWQYGDTYRSNDPIFEKLQRGAISPLCTHASTATKQGMMRWLWQQCQNWAVSKGSVAGKRLVHDFVWFDRALGTISPDGNLGTMWHNEPGFFGYRDSWTLTDACALQVHVPQYYYYGHDDLDRGQIQVMLKKDMVLCNTGFYHTSPSNGPSDFGGTHLNNWKRQTISKSGVILVDDGTALPHQTRDTAGSKQYYPAGLGGQYFKEYPAETIDPENIWTMTGADSGNAWKCTEGLSANESGTLLGDDTEVAVLYSNLRRAYLRFSSDYGTASERVTLLDAKWMVLKNFWTWPCMLVVIRCTAYSSAYQKRQVWHFWGQPTLETPAANRKRIYAASLNQTGGNAPSCAIDYYGVTGWTFNTVGNTSGDLYGDRSFYYGGTNYAPSGLNTIRHKPDVGRFRVEAAPPLGTATQTFIALIIPYIQGELSSLAYTWIEDDNYVGVERLGKAYKLHKTAAQYISPAAPPDTTPPAAPVGGAVTYPASGQVRYSWTANTEIDIAKYKPWYRVKV